jgi:hypothetical protein
MIARIVLQAAIVVVLLVALMSDTYSPPGLAAGYGSSEADLGIDGFATPGDRAQDSNAGGSLACLQPSPELLEYGDRPNILHYRARDANDLPERS